MDKLDVSALNADAIFVPVVPLMLQNADGSAGIVDVGDDVD